ncbi:hypothetical protein ACFWDI_09150 [Streptomyces sp. NPDC060064]|uniref:hypothetical protein n=1 Tax=Streptomyces sp. NPDC060064 TaxID=3347049 RepID=UPI0036B7E0D6
MYHYDDVQHLADALDNGTASVDPSWRTDTRQGRQPHLREQLTGCGCLLLIVPVFVVLCVWRLSTDQPGGRALVLALNLTQVTSWRCSGRHLAGAGWSGAQVSGG